MFSTQLDICFWSEALIYRVNVMLRGLSIWYYNFLCHSIYCWQVCPLTTRHPSHPVTTTNRNMAAKALRLDQHGHIAKYIWMFEKQLNMNMNMNWPLNVVYVSSMTQIVIFRGWGQTVPRSYWDRNIETPNCF